MAQKKRTNSGLPNLAATFLVTTFVYFMAALATGLTAALVYFIRQ